MDYLAIKEAKKKKIIRIVTRIVLTCLVISCIVVPVYCYTHYTFSKFDISAIRNGTVGVSLKDKYNDTLKKIEIPNMVRGKKVWSIALYEAQAEILILPTELNSVNIHDCINLKEITMPDKIMTSDGYIYITNNGKKDYPELSQLTFIVKEGSQAEQYAKDHNIAYRYK